MPLKDITNEMMMKIQMTPKYAKTKRHLEFSKKKGFSHINLI